MLIRHDWHILVFLWGGVLVMKKLRKVIIHICLVCLLFMQAFPICAAAAESGEKRPVRVGVGFSNGLYLNESGKLAGYFSLYIRQIEWLENWKLEFVEVSWPEAVAKMKAGELDLLLPTQYSEERDEFLDFSEYSGGFESIGLYVPADSEISFNEYDALDGKTIGLESDNMCSQDLDKFAEKYHLTYLTKTYDDEAQLEAAMADGQVDMIVSSTMNTVPDSKLIGIIGFVPFYYCTAQGNTELMDELNDGMNNIMMNAPVLMNNVYAAAMVGTSEIGYTKEEQEIINQTDKMVVGMYEDALPLAGLDESGQPIGIYVDIINEIAKITNIPMEPYFVSREDNIFDYLKDGTIDYVICSKQLPYATGDTSWMLGTDPFAEYTTVGVAPQGYSPNKSDHLRIALTKRREYLEDNLNPDYPNATYTYYNSVKECMEAVVAGKADITFVNSWEYNYQSKNSRFSQLVQWESSRITSEILMITTSDRNDAWLNVVDKGVHRLDSDVIPMLITQNVNMPYISYGQADKLYNLWNNAKYVLAAILILGICFGIYASMRRQIIITLKTKNKELEDANAAKSAFLSRMSHELRTPLNAISAYTEEIESNCQSREFSVDTELKSVESIRKALNYQLAIVGDLLNIQQIGSGKIKLVKEEVNVSSLLDGIVEMIRPEVERKNLHFTYDGQTVKTVSCQLDPSRVQHILFNLLHNAVKFTPENGSVGLEALMEKQEGDDALLRFVVSDTGIGMSKEFLETKLFQNFAQEESGTTSPYDGCGIGLATCKELVELMGGRIGCESTKGQGSVFTVELPVQITRKRRERKKHEAVPCDLQGVNVLLCEDNPMNQEIEQKILMRMGCTVDVADNGKIGCELFERSAEKSYSIVLMDIRMPEMDGFEATRTIRAMDREDAKTVPILAVSANSFEEDIRQSLDSGMNEHLAKPVDARILHEKIVQYVK